MSGVICPKCWDASNTAQPPKCGKPDCPGNQTFKPMERK